jgi:DNA-binding MarR family transcriptional regulator
MPAVPSQVRRLLEDPLDTYEKLEIAAALWHAVAHTRSASELATHTQLPIESVEQALSELVAARYVELAGGLARLVVPAAQREHVRALVELYEADRILFVRLLSEISMTKIRGMAARAFADAFQLRKKPEDDNG